MKTLFLALLLAAGSVPAGQLIEIAPEQRQALGIQTTEVEPVEQAWGAAFPAEVRVPNAQLMVVTAPQEGLITRLEVAEGEPVKKGQLLAVIQSPRLVEEQRLYLEALSRLGLARAALGRDKQLKAEGIIAERRFLETRAQYTQAKTEVEQRRQALHLAGMDEKAIRDLERRHRLSAQLEVRSPMEGVVLAQLATPGQRVEIASPIYRIGRLDPLWLEIRVPMERLGGIQLGTAIKVEKTNLQGRIVTIGSTVHGESQSVLVRAEIPNPGGKLRPGQFVEARLAQPSDRRVWRVPRQALLRANDGTWVLVKRDGGFEPLAVKISAEEPDALVIEGPLKTGDEVVTKGTAALKAAWLEGEG